MSDIEERIEEYIDSRLASGQTGYLGYYDRTARRMKRRHLQNRSAAAIGAVLIPVVSNLSWAPQVRGTTIHVATVGASLIGLVVALILALEGVFHFKEQWQNFRGTEQSCSHKNTASKTVWTSTKLCPPRMRSSCSCQVSRR